MPVATAPEPFKARLAGWLLAGLMRLLYGSSRKVYRGLEQLTRRFASGERFILVAWHNRNLVAPFGYLAHRPPGRVFRPLASASRDGTLAALVMRYLGAECLRGSSSRGGAIALRDMVRAVREGADLGITPDGPRGPVHRVQIGAVAAAKLTGLPVIPMSVAARRAKRLKTWDRLLLPAPFTRLAYVYGEPITVPREADDALLEAKRRELETALLALDAEAEALAGSARA